MGVGVFSLIITDDVKRKEGREGCYSVTKRHLFLSKNPFLGLMDIHCVGVLGVRECC